MSTSREKRARREALAQVRAAAISPGPTHTVTIDDTTFSYTPGGQETLEEFMEAVAAAGNLNVTRGPDGTLALTPRPIAPPVQVIPLRARDWGWVHLLALGLP